MAPSVQHTRRVDVPVERAFALFTDHLAAWWPPEYTWSATVLDTVGIEPRVGGRCYERSRYGNEFDWGRVLTWDPPHRLVFSWMISPNRVPEPNPERTSEVEVRFIKDGPDATRLVLEHRHFDRHGGDAESYRAAMGSDQGWPWIIERYAAAASTSL